MISIYLFHMINVFESIKQVSNSLMKLKIALNNSEENEQFCYHGLYLFIFGYDSRKEHYGFSEFYGTKFIYIIYSLEIHTKSNYILIL